ncbi:hypothetical protein [Cysteiniphilum litorale]|uniref:hypothetical protein n=1 Tax=Cysteiniphilum litorale TaxID=2056700 RepID=UPI003F885E6A
MAFGGNIYITTASTDGIAVYMDDYTNNNHHKGELLINEITDEKNGEIIKINGLDAVINDGSGSIYMCSYTKNNQVALLKVFNSNGQLEMMSSLNSLDNVNLASYSSGCSLGYDSIREELYMHDKYGNLSKYDASSLKKIKSVWAHFADNVPVVFSDSFVGGYPALPGQPCDWGPLTYMIII